MSRTVKVIATFYVTALSPTGIGGGFDVIVKTRDVIAYEVDVPAGATAPAHVVRHIDAVVEALLGRADVQSVSVGEVCDHGA